MFDHFLSQGNAEYPGGLKNKGLFPCLSNRQNNIPYNNVTSLVSGGERDNINGTETKKMLIKFHFM